MHKATAAAQLSMHERPGSALRGSGMVGSFKVLSGGKIGPWVIQGSFDKTFKVTSFTQDGRRIWMCTCSTSKESRLQTCKHAQVVQAWLSSGVKSKDGGAIRKKSRFGGSIGGLNMSDAVSVTGSTNTGAAQTQPVRVR